MMMLCIEMSLQPLDCKIRITPSSVSTANLSEESLRKKKGTLESVFFFADKKTRLLC